MTDIEKEKHENKLKRDAKYEGVGIGLIVGMLFSILIQVFINLYVK